MILLLVDLIHYLQAEVVLLLRQEPTSNLTGPGLTGDLYTLDRG